MKLEFMKLFKAQSGRSMVEMLGVLAIIGVLSVGGIAGYSKAMFKYKINQTIQIASQALQNLIEISDKDWGIDQIGSNQEVVDFGLLPAELCPNDYVDHYGSRGFACMAPVGEIRMDFNQLEDKRPSGALSVTFFGGDNKESCVTFLSHGWQNLLPEEWLMATDEHPGSFIAVYSDEDGSYLWAERPDIYTGAKQNNITLSDMEAACGVCSGSLCTIQITINT